MFLLTYMENGFAVTVLRAEGSPGISLKRETGTGASRVWKESSQNVGSVVGCAQFFQTL